MAAIHQKRLEKKYGKFTDMSDLMSKIIAKNSEDLTGQVLKINNSVFQAENKKIGNKEKAVVLPSVMDVITPGVNIRKAKERGELITANLRKKLTDDLREVLSGPDYIRKRGATAGTLKNKLIEDFQEKIKGTFENYTKRDPKIGIPSNIRNISVTECRVVINQTKDDYMKSLLNKNDDIVIYKTWIHNRKLSKVPRKSHQELNGVQIPYNQDFEISDPYELCPYPHWKGLSAENVIGCSCECRYTVEKKRNVKEYNYQHEGD